MLALVLDGSGTSMGSLDAFMQDDACLNSSPPAPFGVDCGLLPLAQHRLRAQAAMLQAQGLSELLYPHDYWLVKQRDVLVDALQAFSTLLQRHAADTATPDAAELTVAEPRTLCDVDATMLDQQVRAVTQLRQDLGWWQ